MTLCNCDLLRQFLDELRKEIPLAGIELHGPPYDWSGVPIRRWTGWFGTDWQPSLLVFLIPQTT
jgi:hypothetical protein